MPTRNPRWRTWFRRRADNDFKAEIESHVRLESDRLIADGMPAAEAQAAARRAFGNVTRAREMFHESQHWLLWDQLGQDLRYGLRSLRKAPAFTAAAAVTIALGVGANTAIFSLMDAALLQSLPVQNPKELVFPQAAGTAGPSGAPPYPCLVRFRKEISSFTGLAAFTHHDELRIEVDGRPEQVVGQVVSGNFYELLGVKPALGRLLEPEDEKLNPPVAVISDHYWRRRFGGDPSVLGKRLSFGKQTFIIVGVVPPEFWGLEPGSRVDLTMPIDFQSRLLADSRASVFDAIARLKPGVSAHHAQAEANAVYQSFISDSGLGAETIRERFQRLELRPAGHGFDTLRRRFSKPLYALMGISGLVLLMAAANIANLLLARGIARQREFAIRLATGAGRARLVRQLITETLLLFGLGALPGLSIAGWGVKVVEALFAEGRRAIALDAGLNWRVLVFSFLITLTAGLLSGLFPAWRAFRTDPEQAIKEGQARASESRGSAILTRALVAFQVALSLVLVVGAAAFVRTLASLRGMDPGFRNDQVLTMSIELPDGSVQAGKSGRTWSRVLEAVRETPGVRAAALSVLTPLSGRNRGAPVQIRGYQPASPADSTIRMNPVSEGYFETLGIPLLRGRPLTDKDVNGAVKVALINETAERKFFAGRDPIGWSIEFGTNPTSENVYRVVGVVRDTKHRDLREAAPPFAFIPLRQPMGAERRVTLSLTSVVPNQEMALLQPIRTAVARVDSGLFISEVITIRRQLDSTLVAERLLSGLSSAFGVLALLLAAVGLYGVLSYRISQQRQSIGIRMALGASPASVAVGVLRQSGVVVAIGLLCGLPFAFLAARTADSILWGVKSSDPAIYIVGAAVLLVAGFASAWLPARRASAIQPAEALRHG